MKTLCKKVILTILTALLLGVIGVSASAAGGVDISSEAFSVAESVSDGGVFNGDTSGDVQCEKIDGVYMTDEMIDDGERISVTILSADADVMEYADTAVLYEDGTLVFQVGTELTAGHGAIVGGPWTGWDTAMYTQDDNVPWYDNAESITTVDFAVPTKPVSTAYWFYYCSNLTDVLNENKLNMSNVTTMNSMFYNCYDLTSLDVSEWDVSNVTNMGYVFSNCSGLTVLDLSQFNTTNVTNMEHMFDGCSGLTELDLSQFDTINVTNMAYMFSNCIKLISIDLSSFNMSNVTTIGFMFQDSRSITTFAIGPDWRWVGSDHALRWATWYNLATDESYSPTRIPDGAGRYSAGMAYADTAILYNDGTLVFQDGASNIGGHGGIRDGCVWTEWDYKTYAYNSPPIWYDNRSDIVAVEFLGYTSPQNTACWFMGFNNLTEIRNINKLDTSHVTNMDHMFYNCSKLTAVDLSGFITSKVTFMSYMFSGCSKVESLDLSSFDTSNVTSMYCMFDYCTGLTALNISSFETFKVTNMARMFHDCGNLTYLNVSNLNTSKVTTMYLMFGDCCKLISLDVSSFDTSNVADMSAMFEGCSKLTSLDLSNFNTSNVTDMGCVFRNCYKLVSLNISNFNTSNVRSMGMMFDGCHSLDTLDISHFSTPKLESMYFMFSDCRNLTSIDLSNFDTSNVSNMAGTFWACIGLTSLNISNLDTSNVTDMANMFGRIPNLPELDLSNFDTSRVKSMSSMFQECKIASLDLSSFDTSKVTSMYGMFRDCADLNSISLGPKWTWLGTNHELSDVPWYDSNTSKEYTAITIPNGVGTYVTLQPVATHVVLYNDGTLVFQRGADDVGGHGGIHMGCVWTGWDTDTDFHDEDWYTQRSNIITVDIAVRTKVTSTAMWFHDCVNLIEIRNINKLDTSNVTDMRSMFSGCSKLASLDLSGFNTSKVESMESMFQECSKLACVKLGSNWTWVGTNYALRDVTWYESVNAFGYTVTTIPDGAGEYSSYQPPANAAILYNDGTLIFQRGTLDIGGHDGIMSNCVWTDWSTKGHTYNSEWYLQRKKIKAIDLAVPVKVTSTQSWFYDCPELTNIYNLDKLDTSSVTTTAWMFYKCPKLVELNVSKFDTTNVTDMYCMFYGLSSIRSLDVSSFNTSNVTSMAHMFRDCSNLTSLDLSSFDTTRASIACMFTGCSQLETITIGQMWKWRSTDHGLRKGAWYDAETDEEFTAITIPSNKAAMYVTTRMINVTIPTTIGVSASADGVCTVDAGSIVNTGRKSVQITNVTAIAQNGWSIGNYDEMTTDTMVFGAKQIGLQIQQDGGTAWCKTNGTDLTFDQNAFPKITAAGEYALNCDVKVPVQKSAVDVEPMKIVFTVKAAA